ncbi:hypothetical protein SAY86_030482 [Trapa natans]|uniref:IPT/TIG domain-containing protein n=1 Tax=Trapa natans TaxID=22666 RepID=A0AAN7MN38_TRANT|nr:hypothetical protein SAY86_030482 [Trapa natans]
MQSQNSPATPVNSNSSTVSDPSASWLLSEELDSGVDQTIYTTEKELTGSDENLTVKNHELRLHEINTLEWDELVTDDPSMQVPGKGSYLGQKNIAEADSIESNGQVPNNVVSLGNIDGLNALMEVQENSDSSRNKFSSLITSNLMDFMQNDGLQSHDSFGKWMSHIMFDSDPADGTESLLSFMMENYPSDVSELKFTITDIAPAWAFSNEKTKVIITGFFIEGHPQLSKANLFCICGEHCVSVEVVQNGVYRCLIPPHSSGLVNLFMSFDSQSPISQIVNFEYRTPLVQDPVPSTEEKLKDGELQLQMRLAFLLFSTSKCLDITASKISSSVQKDAKKFSFHTANILKDWVYLLSLVEENKLSSIQAKDSIFELMLKNRLKDWILERIITGCKASEYDLHGQGVIHLCAILGYTWAVQLFSWSDLSLDFRDKFGWTALHWAAYHGREKMVAKLLSAGAKPNLVTDPTSNNPTGYTASDLASQRGYEGLSAYLAEKSLVQHFQDMSLAGNASGSLQTTSNHTSTTESNLCKDDVYLKDTLAAYRTAADAAARIQAAFREHSFKIRSQQVRCSNPEEEARNIVAAMKIQHAFRNYDSKKKMAAAAQIQYCFRTWKIRREFLNMRNQAIKIQAAFRGFQVRRQYRKIVWSVGVVEKAILRWRFKRRGFRGFHVKEKADLRQDSDTEEDFFRAGRKQAEERLEQSVVKVQSMFRSKKAQEEYRRMKLAYDEAKLEYEAEHNEQLGMER